MKSTKKLIFGIAAAIAIPATINHLIFKNALTSTDNDHVCDEHYYNWKFGKIRYTVRGTGKPLLLLHKIDIGSGSHEWQNNINNLAKHHKVYAFDFLGFGYSEKPKLTYTAYLYTSLINDFIKNVIKEKTHVIASCSASAYVLMATKFESKHFDKIMLISPTGIAHDNFCINSKYLKTLLELPVIGTSVYTALSSRIAIKNHLMHYCLQSKASLNTEYFDKSYHTAHLGYAAAKFPIASLMSGYLDSRMTENIKDTNLTIHIVWGENSLINPFYSNSAINLEKYVYETTVIKNAKLLPHVEKPTLFYKSCRNFFMI